VSTPGLTRSDPFVVGVIQDQAGADPASNLARAERLIRDAAARGAQIICLKELFNRPYFCKAQRADRFDFSEPIPGPTTDRLQAVAKEVAVVLIVPLFERQAAGVYRNSAAVIDADGSLLGVYRKMHIPDDPLFYEKYYFTPGDATAAGSAAPVREARGFKIWKTQYATIGVLICWDQWYPEAARITSLLGAQILFYPTAIGWHPDEKDEWGSAQVDAWRTTQRAHAIANGVYVAAVNRVGHEVPPEGGPGLEFWGTTFLADPFGVVVAEASPDREEILVGEVSPPRIEEVRRNWPFLRDRRVDAYAGLDRRFLD
jgi:N-carbamoylputrescine amidase